MECFMQQRITNTEDSRKVREEERGKTQSTDKVHLSLPHCFKISHGTTHLAQPESRRDTLGNLKTGLCLTLWSPQLYFTMKNVAVATSQDSK